MSWQFVIDTIKEWVLSLGYATQAWVLAKVYATEAWVEAKVYATEAWVEAKGYLADGFVDRGDPANYDFDTADFTRDNNWHDLFLVALVPPGTKAVLVRYYCVSSSLNRSFLLRGKGNVNSINWVQCRPAVANVIETMDAVCPVGTGRKLEYRVTHTDLYSIHLTIKGWWF